MPVSWSLNDTGLVPHLVAGIRPGSWSLRTDDVLGVDPCPSDDGTVGGTAEGLVWGESLGVWLVRDVGIDAVGTYITVGGPA